MTTYTAIPDTVIDVKKPILAGTGRALRDNTLAIQEGDSTAPRVNHKAVKPHFRYQTGTSGEVIFTGFSGVDGGYVEVKIDDYAGGDTMELQIAFSNDGTTYGTDVVLLAMPGGGGTEQITFNVNIDFLDAELRWGYVSSGFAVLGSSTASSIGTTSSTEYVRIRRIFTSGAGSGTNSGDIYARFERWGGMV